MKKIMPFGSTFFLLLIISIVLATECPENYEPYENTDLCVGADGFTDFGWNPKTGELKAGGDISKIPPGSTVVTTNYNLGRGNLLNGKARIGDDGTLHLIEGTIIVNNQPISGNIIYSRENGFFNIEGQGVIDNKHIFSGIVTNVTVSPRGVIEGVAGENCVINGVSITAGVRFVITPGITGGYVDVSLSGCISGCSVALSSTTLPQNIPNMRFSGNLFVTTATGGVLDVSEGTIECNPNICRVPSGSFAVVNNVRIPAVDLLEGDVNLYTTPKPPPISGIINNIPVGVTFYQSGFDTVGIAIRNDGSSPFISVSFLPPSFGAEQGDTLAAGVNEGAFLVAMRHSEIPIAVMEGNDVVLKNDAHLLFLREGEIYGTPVTSGGGSIALHVEFNSASGERIKIGEDIIYIDYNDVTPLNQNLFKTNIKGYGEDFIIDSTMGICPRAISGGQATSFLGKALAWITGKAVEKCISLENTLSNHIILDTRYFSFNIRIQNVVEGEGCSVITGCKFEIRMMGGFCAVTIPDGRTITGVIIEEDDGNYYILAVYKNKYTQEVRREIYSADGRLVGEVSQEELNTILNKIKDKNSFEYKILKEGSGVYMIADIYYDYDTYTQSSKKNQRFLKMNGYYYIIDESGGIDFSNPISNLVECSSKQRASRQDCVSYLREDKIDNAIPPAPYFLPPEPPKNIRARAGLVIGTTFFSGDACRFSMPSSYSCGDPTNPVTIKYDGNCWYWSRAGTPPGKCCGTECNQ